MTVSIPAPILSWERVVSLSDPLREPSRQRLRSLRVRANLSPGVHVTPRRGGRASGSLVYYSALSALSAKARESGETEIAAELGKAGTELESWISPALREFLATRPVSELSEAPFYAELVGKTRAALDRVKIDFVLMTGRIDGTVGEFTSVVADTDGETLRVDLPSRLLNAAGASDGDHVWIIRQIIGSAAVLTVLPAVLVDDDNRGQRYLERGAGAPISDAEAAYFRNRAQGSLPKARILRPAG